MAAIERIREFHDELTLWRRDLHAHPELGFEEERTSDLVAERLAGFGIEVHRGIGKTGVVGRLRLGNSPRAIGLRADMDCLPILEANTFAHRSRAPSVRRRPPPGRHGTRSARSCWSPARTGRTR